MTKSIGFIGIGMMGEALLRGILGAKLAKAARIWASDVREERRQTIKNLYHINVSADNLAVAQKSEIIILAVKPQTMPAVLKELKGRLAHSKLILSIAAGVPIAKLQALGPEVKIIRAMPNLAATVLASATAIAPGPRVRVADLKIAKKIFSAVGQCVLVQEPMMDAVTGLSGSGPGYIMLVIEALADGGVKMGLPREVALTLAAQTVYGAAKLQIESQEHPAKIKDRVASPGGTTIAGLHALEDNGLRSAFIDAVEAATLRSQELGGK
jgi:pyrroline-5-carboxylate reductase